MNIKSLIIWLARIRTAVASQIKLLKNYSIKSLEIVLNWCNVHGYYNLRSIILRSHSSEDFKDWVHVKYTGVNLFDLEFLKNWLIEGIDTCIYNVLRGGLSIIKESSSTIFFWGKKLKKVSLML